MSPASASGGWRGTGPGLPCRTGIGCDAAAFAAGAGGSPTLSFAAWCETADAERLRRSQISRRGRHTPASRRSVSRSSGVHGLPGRGRDVAVIARLYGPARTRDQLRRPRQPGTSSRACGFVNFPASPSPASAPRAQGSSTGSSRRCVGRRRAETETIERTLTICGEWKPGGKPQTRVECGSVWGPGAYRRRKYLTRFAREGSRGSADSHYAAERCWLIGRICPDDPDNGRNLHPTFL